MRITHRNVTVRNVRARCVDIQDDCLWIGRDGTHVSDSTIGGGDNGSTNTGAGIGVAVPHNGRTGGVGSVVLERLDISHTADGVRADGQLTLRGSWLHDPDMADGNHGDAVQSTGWTRMLFAGNTMVWGNNADLFLSGEPGNPGVSDVDVIGNWFGGWGPAGNRTSYPLWANNCTNVRATGNRWVNTLFDGPVSDRSGSCVTLWLDNRYADGVNGGVVIGAP